jgi:acyl carrier protein phosphodiesterase
VLVDLFYDHFLAVHWEDYADVPLSVFISDAWRILGEHKEFLPDKLQRIIPFMFRDWLPSYGEKLWGQTFKIQLKNHTYSCVAVANKPLFELTEH